MEADYYTQAVVQSVIEPQVTIREDHDLLLQGVKVRVYSPTVAEPAFAATGDLVSVPAVPIPGRSEYRFPLALTARVKREVEWALQRGR